VGKRSRLRKPHRIGALNELQIGAPSSRACHKMESTNGKDLCNHLWGTSSPKSSSGCMRGTCFWRRHAASGAGASSPRWMRRIIIDLFIAFPPIGPLPTLMCHARHVPAVPEL
jgi:hypothetical protein